MAMSHGELNNWLRDRSRDQLRTFYKRTYVRSWRRIGVYRRSNNNDSGTYWADNFYGSYMHVSAGSESSSVFNGALASGVGPGKPIRSKDVVDSIISAVRKAVDRCEARIPGNFDQHATIYARVCHNSCHSSCHGSRGRR